MKAARIIINGQHIAAATSGERSKRVTFTVWDDGDVYNAVSPASLGADKVQGILFVRDGNSLPPDTASSDTVKVEVIEMPVDWNTARGRRVHNIGGRAYIIIGFVRTGASWKETTVEVIPVQEDLFLRHRGLLETGVLAGKTVFVKGAGSVGSTVTRFLAQCGLNAILMDGDRLEVSNVVRHEAGLSHIGRFKTKAMADLIREKNPYAKIVTVEEMLGEHNIERVRELVRASDLCIDTGDKREGKLLLNRICLEEQKPLIVSGAFRRAHGGQVLRVRPWQTACYQCFVKLLAHDNSPFPDPEAEAPVYSDRPVPIEPGLSIDIEPISHMTAKVALQELLKGMPTTLRSLGEDLEANWFLFLNRREVGTPYETLKPLGFGVDDMRILRWYGIEIARDPGCPHCGDYASVLAQQEGLTVTEEDVAEFLGTSRRKEDRHGG